MAVSTGRCVRGSHPGRHILAHFVATKRAGVFWRYCCVTAIAQKNVKGEEVHLALQKIQRVFCDGHSSLEICVLVSDWPQDNS